jgi:polyisoprenoid-binding protein YceI
VLIVVVVVVVVLGILAVLEIDALFGPVHHTWGTTLETRPGMPATASQTFPLASPLNGTWSVAGNGPANLTITTFGGTVYSENLTHGTFQLVSSGFEYIFTASTAGYANVTIQVSYTTHGSSGFGADVSFKGDQHASSWRGSSWPSAGPRCWAGSS